jgi:hypothetical protein
LGCGDYFGEFVDGGAELVLEVADAIVRWCCVSFAVREKRLLCNDLMTTLEEPGGMERRTRELVAL